MTVNAATDTLIRSAFSNSGADNFQSLTQFNDFISVIEQSSVLVTDIENLISANGSNALATNTGASIVLGNPGGGTFANNKVLN